MVDAEVARADTSPPPHELASPEDGHSGVDEIRLEADDPSALERFDLALPRDPVQQANHESEPSLIHRELSWQYLQELKRILRHGTFESEHTKIKPFVFRAAEQTMTAEAAGLEGFVFSERVFRQRFGTQASAAHVEDYITYVRSLLNGAGYTSAGREALDLVAACSEGTQRKYERFIEFLNNYVEDLRESVRSADPARWSHSLRTYHIFVRAFNLAGWRAAHGVAHDSESGRFFADLGDGDIRAMQSLSFNCVRLMGTYPIGEINRKGSAGGSPFALRSYGVDPAHGTEVDVREFIKKAATRGLRTIFEIVLNHTSPDSQLLDVNPRLYIHTRTKPEDPTGYFHYVSPVHGEFWIRQGGYKDKQSPRVYWDDTLQLDLSNPDTRRLLVQISCEIVRKYGPHGLRFDAAEGMLHQEWAHCWAGDSGKSMALPKQELLADIVHGVKSNFPGVVCIAEAYKHWDKLSEIGFDLIYGFEDMEREVDSPHQGWQAALLSRDPQRIRSAIRRAEFLHWQEGGADMCTFWGHQDKAPPWRLFSQEWIRGAEALTVLKPGPLCFYASTEAGYECVEAGSDDPKAISFNIPARVDWSGIASEAGRFQAQLLKFFREMEKVLGDPLHFRLLEPHDPKETWVGYVVQRLDAAPEEGKVIVVVNPTSEPTAVTIERPDLRIRNFRRDLPACGKDSVRIFKFAGQLRSPSADVVPTDTPATPN